jgi:serine/threonine-protein phosphatase PGAM5
MIEIRTVLVMLLWVLVAPAIAAEPQLPATRTIVLVRHGNYVDDPAADPRLGPHISPIGVAQAHLVGARLAAMPTRFDVLYASPLQRARDTAAVIAEDFPGRHFEVVDDLAECTPPTRRAEVMAQEKPEDLASCQAQLDRVFARFFRPPAGHEETDLLVCHGNVIRYLVARAGRRHQGVAGDVARPCQHHQDPGRGRWALQGDLGRRRRPPATEPADRGHRRCTAQPGGSGHALGAVVPCINSDCP